MNSTEENDSSWTLVGKKRSPNKKAVQPTNTNLKMNIDVKKKPPTNKATRPFVTKETMIIEPEMMGLVAGRKGSNLKRLREFYGVNIKLPPKGGSQIILEGPPKMILAAKKDIEENMSYKTNFSIEKDHTRLLIGPDGEKVQALEDELNVRIEIKKENGEVAVTGKRCEEAKKAIKENLSSVTSFFIEKDYSYLVIGQEGQTIRDLKKVHNVEIHINEEGKVSIVGKECEEAKKAIETLIEKFKTDYPYKEKFSVPESIAGFICGKNGSNVKRIASTYGVFVFITPSPSVKDESQVLVIGSVAENVSTAKNDMLEKLIEMSLDVDESFVGLIIGRGAERLRCLEKEHGVKIEFERQKDQQDGKVTRKAFIFGEKERTAAARNAVISIISEESKKVAAATIDENL